MKNALPWQIDLQLFNEEDFILPDDFTAEEEHAEESTAPQVEEEQPTEPVEDTTPTEDVDEKLAEHQPEPVKLKIKYNHQEIELGEDEAVPLIQKGMNYDKLQERLNATQADAEKYGKLKQLSELYGMQDDQLLEALYNQYYEATAQQNGLTAEQIRKDTELKQKEQALKQKEETLTKSEADKQMYAKFLETFPNAKPADIKPETWQKVNSGMDLTTAYVLQQNEELQAKIKTMEQNIVNKEKAPVKGVTTHGSTEQAEEDDFLRGFNSI